MPHGVFKLVGSDIMAAAALGLNCQVITDLGGMTAVTLEARFKYGSGGPGAWAVVQTSLDGENWIDIARFHFTTESSVQHCNLEGLLSKDITEYRPLAVLPGVYDGVLGDRLRCVVGADRAFTDSFLSIRAAVR